MRDRPIARKPLVNIPAISEDEWVEQALCHDNPPTDPDFCYDCPVMLECDTLHTKLSVDMKIPGVWGGVKYPELGATRPGGARYPKGSRPVNGGECLWPLCDRLAYRRGMCNPHYRLDMRNKRDRDGVETVEQFDAGASDG